jgi:hypothetical protein
MAATSSGNDDSIESAINLVRKSIEQSDEHSVDEHFDEDDVRASVEKMEQYGIPPEDMASSYISQTFDSNDRPAASRSGSRDGGDDPLVDIASQDALAETVNGQTDTDGAFLASVFTVADLLEPVHEEMRQRLLAATETGRIPIAVWSGCNTEFEEGETYHVTGIKGDFDDEEETVLLGLNEAASVTADPSAEDLAEQYDESVAVDFEVPEYDALLEGVIAKVDGGWIQRCQATVEGRDGEERPCNRALDNGTCEDHGKVESEADLRVQMRVDNAEQSHRVYATDAETVEELTGLSLEDAREMMEDTMNPEMVRAHIEKKILGTPIEVHARRFSGQAYGVQDFEFDLETDEEAVDATAARLRSQVIALGDDESDVPEMPANEGEVAAGD